METEKQSTKVDLTAMTTSIKKNEFSDNLNIQVLTFNNRRYKASLLEFDCQMDLVKLKIEENSVTRSQFIGVNSPFVFINGGIATITDNSFSYNGLLTTKVYNNTAEAYNAKRQFSHVYFPY